MATMILRVLCDCRTVFTATFPHGITWVTCPECKKIVTWDELTAPKPPQPVRRRDDLLEWDMSNPYRCDCVRITGPNPGCQRCGGSGRDTTN